MIQVKNHDKRTWDIFKEKKLAKGGTLCQRKGGNDFINIFLFHQMQGSFLRDILCQKP